MAFNISLVDNSISSLHGFDRDHTIYPERSPRGRYYDIAPLGLLGCRPERCRVFYPERSRGGGVYVSDFSSRLRSTNSLWSRGAVTRIPPQRGEMFFTPSEAEGWIPSEAEVVVFMYQISRLGFARRAVFMRRRVLTVRS
jgi:hypothetical protein